MKFITNMIRLVGNNKKKKKKVWGEEKVGRQITIFVSWIIYTASLQPSDLTCF